MKTVQKCSSCWENECNSLWLYVWRHGHPYIHRWIFQLPVWTSVLYKAVFLPSAGPHCWSFLHTAVWLILQQSRVTWPHEHATPAKQTQELLLATQNNTIKTQMPTVEAEHASLALSFPVVCDHIFMVIRPRWFQPSNQTKQLLKAHEYKKSIIGKEFGI